MRILLTGRNGQVGWELERALPALGTVAATDRASFDLTDFVVIRNAIRQARPQVIVNAAAYTWVDRAEVEPQVAMRVNGEAPAVLAEEARALDALLLHFSTDYVFDGSKTTPYTEVDLPGPLNVYGRSKLAGDVAIQQSGCRHLILRTGWVYSARARNFAVAIVQKARKERQIHVVGDQIGTPTSASLLAQATVAAIAGCMRTPELAGLYNVAAAGEVTRSGFAEALLADLNEDAKVVPISSAELPSTARRPSYSVLDTRLFRSRFGFALPHWRDEQRRVLAPLRAGR